MRSHHLLGLASLLALAATSIGCGRSACSDSVGAASPRGEQSDTPVQAGTATPSGDATRAVAEADIIQIDGDRLYAMSKSGNVAIVDVSHPAALTLLGNATLAGEPFEMYRNGSFLFTMSNAAVDASGTIRPIATDSSAALPTTNHDNDGSVITSLDVSDASHPRPLGQFVIPGQIADSRMVGNILYVATYENASCFQCGKKPRTIVTSFDLTNPGSPKKVEQMEFASNAPDEENLAWGLAWKRSIFVNDQRLYVGGHADRDLSSNGIGDLEGIVDVVDITDPTGHLGKGAHLTLPGAVLSRWQMDETGGVFRVISQRGAGITGNGTAMPEIDTFTITSTTEMPALGHATISLPRQEGLRTVRFDGARAYAITFNQTDPLFALDLSDPANPKQRGQLQMPGWMFYLEPHGDRVIGLGVDRTDSAGTLNVSLFDVSNMDAPTLVKRVSFGEKYLNEDYEITNYELPEDQDRIQKAFRVFQDGLIAVPFSGLNKSPNATQCDSTAGGIQLISWKNDTLEKGAFLSMQGNPRRAFERDTHVLGVSDSNVSAFALANATSAVETKPASDLVIGKCVVKTLPGYGGYAGGDEGAAYDSYGGFGTCE